LPGQPRHAPPPLLGGRQCSLEPWGLSYAGAFKFIFVLEFWPETIGADVIKVETGGVINVAAA